MKKMTMFAAVCALALGLASPSALAASIPAGSYLGLIDDGIPANPTNEVNFINILIDRPLGSGPTLVGTESYTRSSNVLCGAACPDAVLAGSIKDDTSPSTTVDVTGFTYLLAKYDGPNYGSAVWYVGNLSGEYEIPAALGGRTGSQYGLSHWSLYKTDEFQRVPDGGMTLMLLGGALVGLETLRRRSRA